MRVASTPPALMRALAVASVVGQAGIAVTGAVVRVTGSGLGCPTWPQCFPGSLVPEPRPDVAALHQWVEFGNRLIGVTLTVVTAACLLAALARRPRSRRLVGLAATMPLGVVLQAVLGGLTVLTGLVWYTVALHLLVSMPLVWLAVLLVRESSPRFLAPGAAPRRPVVTRRVRALLVTLTGVLGVLLTLGTLVTAAGPHAGDAATRRLDWADTEQLATAHGGVVLVLVGLLLALGVVLRVDRAPAPLRRRHGVLVAVTLAQGVLGGVQYALGVPEVLVALHVLGAALAVAATAALWAAATDVAPAPSPAAPSAAPAATPSATGPSPAGAALPTSGR